jgi:hypothetical protein
VKSALTHFDAAKQEAARKIGMALNHYGNIAAKALDRETAAIDDILRELGTGNYPALVSLLALDDWLSQLHVENEQFKSLMMARYDEVAGRPAARMRATRIEVDKSFRSLTAQIEALAMVNGMAAYEKFIRELNAIIERYKNILAQEAGRRAAKKSGGDETEN